MKYVMGNYFDALMEELGKLQYPLSFLSDEFTDVEAWQAKALAEVKKLLSYTPKDVPLDTQILDEYEKDGLRYTHVSYAEPFGPRTEGILLRPANATGKLPGVLAMHDHGGFKYYGKEKITYPKNHPDIMHDYKDHYYGGRAWACELAKRGYMVFIPDMFLWGSRKMLVESVPAHYVQKALDTPVDSREHIAAYNDFAAEHEHLIAKTFTEAGLTWPGIMAACDSRAIDFLLSQPDVDADNIGCGGLSCGGLRTVFLAATDARVKCSICVGFMCTSEELAAYKIYTHTWMLYLPGLTNLMDFADLYSLHGKKPTMVLYDEDDQLYTPKGQHGAHDRLTAIYAKMGAPELYRGQFFPGPHKFDAEMQAVAFDFYDEFLK